MPKKKTMRIFSPEIKILQNTQLFEFNGKDARGYDFSVKLCPLKEPLFFHEPSHTIDADQVEAFFGGDPANMNDIGTELEIQLGKEPKVFKLNSTAIVYIPKGLSHTGVQFKAAPKHFWYLNITLPPKYVKETKPART